VSDSPRCASTSPLSRSAIARASTKLNDAVDAVRRTEVTTRPELKHTRWLWLKNFSNLSGKQKTQLHQLMRPSAKLATGRALRWREDFQAFYDQDPSYAPEYLRRWCYPATRLSRTVTQPTKPSPPRQPATPGPHHLIIS
jgi:transposase